MKISRCTLIGYSFFGAFFLAFLIACVPAFYVPKRRPPTPKFNLDSITLENIDMSSYHVNADWDFTFSIENTNQFGWSYGLTAHLYHDDIYVWRGRGIKHQTYITAAKIPTFWQAGKNQTAFTARFKGVSVPVNCEWSARNSEFSNVELELTLQGYVEPIPRKSLSWFMRWFVDGIEATCANVKIGVSSDSTGVAHVYGTNYDSRCYAIWDTVWDTVWF